MLQITGVATPLLVTFFFHVRWTELCDQASGRATQMLIRLFSGRASVSFGMELVLVAYVMIGLWSRTITLSIAGLLVGFVLFSAIAEGLRSNASVDKVPVPAPVRRASTAVGLASAMAVDTVGLGPLWRRTSLEP